MGTRFRAREPERLPVLLGPGLLAVLTMFYGCASMQDTPEQQYVWAMGRICDAKSNTWFMDKVEPDGAYTVRGAPNSVPSPNIPYFDCMKEQFEAHPYPEWTQNNKKK